MTIQGEAALRAAELVQAEPGERILDIAAAPGGKTLVMAGSGAEVLAVDVRPRRLEKLPSAIQRLQPSGVVRMAAMDGDTGLGETAFDAVLLDAPCSNTAVLAGRPGARWRFGPASLRALTELQSRLLVCAARRVRPGGRLVYSTCSLEPEEGQRMISAWLAQNAGWDLEEEHTLYPSTQVGGPADGGYAARLRWNPK